MLEWIVWTILFILLAATVILLRYWTELLKKQDTYHRSELVDFPQILNREIRIIRGDGIHGAVAAAAGILLGWFLTLLGGLLSPDVGPEPDWAANQLPNYFFQSVFSVLIFHLAWPAVRNLLPLAPGFLRNFFDADNSFFWGLSVCLASVSLTAWGVDHEMNFLFVLINGILLLAYSVYRLNLTARAAIENADSGDFSTSEFHDEDGTLNEDFTFLDEEAPEKKRSGTEF